MLFFDSPSNAIGGKIFAEVNSQWWNQGCIGEYCTAPQMLYGASAPTTSTTGIIGQLYVNTSNCNTYQCTAISGSGSGATYTWTQRW
jgi:hypothetical protein